MSFLDTCIQDSLPIWRSCMETPFLRGVADGTLDEECFKGYIVDDSLYLREYSKVFAWGILHSSDMEEIRNYYTLLAFVNDYAGERYESICKAWEAFTEKVCASIPPEREAHCLEIFRTCSEHERHFWEMAARPRTDLGGAQA